MRVRRTGDTGDDRGKIAGERVLIALNASREGPLQRARLVARERNVTISMMFHSQSVSAIRQRA